MRVLPIVLLLAVFDGPVHAESRPVDLPRHAIVFAGHSDVARTDYDLWSIAPDGSQLASLVTLPGHQVGFDLSPDGERIVYADTVDGDQDLYVRDYHGKTPTRITDDPGVDRGPRFSPDGSHIAFFSTRDAEKPDLYVMEIASGQTRRLTDDTWYDSGASWTPDGSALYFTRFFPSDDDAKRSGHGVILRVDVATGETTRVVDAPGYNGGVDVSPDGTRIAWHNVNDGAVDIWSMAVDGSDRRRLTTGFLDEYSPAWSPDGAWIVYTAGTGNDGQGTFDLYLMRADGRDAHRIATIPNTQMEPRWRPGSWLVR